MARELSWRHHGRRIAFHLPGMFTQNGATGRYPALSITGEACALACDHCRGGLLKPMLKATDPAGLVRRCQTLAAEGCLGVLVSGGCDPHGRLPWADFIDALAEVKATTPLTVSVHSGFVDQATAKALGDAGVDQALVDIVGSDDTYRRVCHVDQGLTRLRSTLEALGKAGLPVVPHIVCGLHYGELRGEIRALDMVAALKPELVVILSLMPMPGTPMAGIPPPGAEAVARMLVETRLRLPGTAVSLGCARPRGHRAIEMLAVEAGVNRMALPSDEARQRAAQLGLAIEYRRTCCSVQRGPAGPPW